MSANRTCHHYGLTPPEDAQPLWQDATSHEDPGEAVRAAELDEAMDAELERLQHEQRELQEQLRNAERGVRRAESTNNDNVIEV
jgi:hypothetical protein